MPAERYFLPNALEENQSIILEGTEFHHLANVMRSVIGESVEVVNGQGVLGYATIEKLEKKKAILKVLKVDKQAPPKQIVILAQAIPRLNRLDFILEKGTELGMTHLWLFPGERSERHKFNENQLERFNNVCVAAMKQCGRLYLPEISLKPAIVEWKKLEYPLYFGDVNPDAPFLVEKMEYSPKGFIFCVGPESGFTENEEDALRLLGGIGVKLHGNILRTDTAAIAALTLLTHKLSQN